jgi:hypothetical protein
MTDATLSTCNCCAGIARKTPLAIDNRPGLSAITHRVGSHSSFRASLEAALSSRDVSPLRNLGTRSDDDITIALIDGFSAMADVLTFYSERIANESFLRTATERRSVLELARLIGYQLSPGLSAETFVAFTVDEGQPGGPRPTPVGIESGARIQSVPGPGESPQTFETTAPITARWEWNAVPLQTREPQPVSFGQRSLVLGGRNHNLASGDVLLIVGDERSDDAGSERWDARLIRAVEIDERAETTRVSWLEGLGSVMPRVNPARDNARAYVFRQRAALFGHNAPDPRLLNLSPEAKTGLVADLANGTWKNFGLAGQTIDLDQSYPKVVPGSWIVLLSEDPPHFASSLPGYAELYRARTVGHQSISAFGLASKVTRVGLDGSENLNLFGRRETLVLCQSEELEIVARPVRSPVYGTGLDFGGLVPGLSPGQDLAVSGASQHIKVTPEGKGTVITYRDGKAGSLEDGDRLALLAAPTADDGIGGRVEVDADDLANQLDPLRSVPRPLLRWDLQDRDGRPVSAVTSASAFSLDVAELEAPGVAGDRIEHEIVRIGPLENDVTDDRDRTRIRLAAALARPYDRASVRVNANIAAATHGETVRELAGGGDAGRPNQRLSLRQKPLTFVGASTPEGRKTTLEVRVDGTRWQERPTLFEAPSNAQVYAVEIADDQTAELVFGDGAEGARLPTGQANVRARYRKGIGSVGNIGAGTLTTLLVRPGGVNSATNPEAASGGEDPESLADARLGAPLTVLTLGRAVSRLDYADFARGFAGIAKADAAWIGTGAGRGLVVTIAGPHGVAIAPGNKTADRLGRALYDYGDQLLPIRITSYRDARFLLQLDIKVEPNEEEDSVVDAVRNATIGAFAFENRAFGQGVSLDEVVAVAHSVRGVVAADVNGLRRVDQPPGPLVRARLAPDPTMLTAGDTILPAEILTIDASQLLVGTMS